LIERNSGEAEIFTTVHMELPCEFLSEIILKIGLHLQKL